MAKIDTVSIRNYRSIENVEICLPEEGPLVLIGENNSGKSNIVRALQVALGPFWPGTHDPEDHEFFKREPDREINIVVSFRTDKPMGGRFRRLKWKYNRKDDPPVFFQGETADPQWRFVRNTDRDTCACIVIDADRSLSYHLSYASKWTFLSRLMHKFHRELQNSDAIKTQLEDLFAQVKHSFNEIPAFAKFVADLQTGMENLVTSMTHRLEVDFEAYNPVNFFHALRLQASEDGFARTLAEMGTGEQQVLAMAFAHAYAEAFHEGILLVVEEPEAHLHPLAQQWLAQRLRKFDFSNLQMIITTHSPAFVDLMNLDGLVLVRKADSTFVTQLTADVLTEHCLKAGANPKRTKSDTILSYYASNSTREILEGFFAKVVVLVEGPTESLALPVLFSRVGVNTLKLGIAVIAVGGKGNLAKWRRLFSAYEIPSFVVFDNDIDDDKSGTKRKDALASVGVDDDDDQLVSTSALLVAENFAIFGDDYEATLVSLFPEYQELERSARAKGIDGKPLIARYVAEKLDRKADANQAGWKKVKELADNVAALA